MNDLFRKSGYGRRRTQDNSALPRPGPRPSPANAENASTKYPITAVSMVNIETQVEGLAGLNGAAIEVVGAKYKWTG